MKVFAYLLMACILVVSIGAFSEYCIRMDWGDLCFDNNTLLQNDTNNFVSNASFSNNSVNLTLTIVRSGLSNIVASTPIYGYCSALFTDLNSSKLDKSGGALTGNISLSSNLGFFVNSTVYSVWNGSCFVTRVGGTYSYVC